MDSGLPNPYSPPKTEDCLPESKVAQESRPIIPPLAPWRLVVAILLIAIAWGALWAQVNDRFYIGMLVTVICCQQIPKLLDPHGLRNRGRFRPFHAILSIIGTATVIGLLWYGERIPAPGKEALMHPVLFGFGWMISCGFLFSDWWKRRNNPPFSPKPHAVLPSESPWKPLPRAQDP